jgi:hypothetical protein
MYLFLYQNSTRHQPRYRYGNRSRAAKDSTYNQFNLAQLRKAMKDRFTLYGYGTHPAQQALDKMGLSHLMLGHVIEIEDPKLAVWMKINYDQVCKNKTTYIGSYLDIDHEYINKVSEEMREFDTIASKTSTSTYYLEQLQNQMKYFSQRRDSYDAVSDSIYEKIDSLVGEMGEENDKMKAVTASARTGSASCTKAVEEYVKARMIGKVGT